MDLWAREHYKSTIITFGKTIQDILNNPNETISLFSHTRPVAKGFLRQIKREFEGNGLLKRLFPDILWADPQSEAPKWSEDDGLIVRRTGNPKESTLEAWGLVDGQPTSKHFNKIIYDDIVTVDNTRSPEMISKTIEAWELSTNLGAKDGVKRYVGTRYHFNDPYRSIMERGINVRIYACTADGRADGEPVLLSKDALAQKRREQGPYVFGCQMLLNPKADEMQGFKSSWLKHAEPNRHGLNIYILADPANAKKKTSDYTCIWVIGLGADENFYILDGLRDRLSLTQRTEALFNFHKKWRPIRAGYETYGLQADIEHIEDRQKRENYRFEIVPLGGNVPKNDRIKKLIPLFEQGRMYLPHTLFKTNYEGKTEDLVSLFIEHEYKAFPVAIHDDMLDAMARIVDPDMKTQFPAAFVQTGQLKLKTGVI